MRKQGYRADVDGLRALAVLVILAFHLDVAGFSGGFVGVDIFFVISGYVILRRALPNIKSGVFSIKSFYERRIRRIFPGLLATLAITLAAGAYLLSPNAYDELGGSVLASLVFGPNFFFHDRTGYFAGAAYGKPLLHMWSLGIEEQFYLFLPLLLLAFAKSKKAKPETVLTTVTALSFAYCVISTTIDPTHAFYMPMARLWEIGLGGMVSIAEYRRKPKPLEAQLWATLGLLLIALAVLVFDSDTAFPGWAAMLPALGTTFLIFAGSASPKTPLVNQGLALKPIVAIGGASYALYLVHWPLIVYTRIWLSHPLFGPEKAVLALVAVVLSFLVWQYIEKPFRKGDREWPISTVLKGLGTAAACLALTATFAIISQGWPSRMTAEAQQVKIFLDEAKHANPICTPQKSLFPVIHKNQRICLYGNDVRNAVVIWGDSHAGVFAPSLAKELASQNRSLLLISLPDCVPLRGIEVSHRKSPKACTALVNHTMAFLRERHGGTVIIAGRWANLGSPVKAPGDGEKPRRLFDLENRRAPITLEAALDRTIRDLTESGTKVVLIGSIPEIDYDVPNTLMSTLNGIGKMPPVSRTAFDLRQSKALEALHEAENIPGVNVIYPHKRFCTADRCDVNKGLKAFYNDDDHLSPFGVARVLPDILLDLTERQK